MLPFVRRVRDLRPVTLPSVDQERTALPPSVVQRGMRLGVAEGVLTQVHLSLTVGTLATGLALLLGASSFELGVLAALPVLGTLIQLPAAWWVERTGKRRRLAVAGSLGRQLWIVPAVLLFLPLATPAKLVLFLLASAVGHMMLAAAANAWTGWMTDLIPASVRGRYFGARGAMMSGAAMITGYGGAWLVDRGRAAGDEASVYAGLLVLAVVSGGLGSVLLSRQPEPAPSKGVRYGWRDLLLLPARHQRFRAWVGAFMVWQTGLGVAAPFFIAYGLTELKLPLQTLALMDTISALTGLVAQPYWGRLADRLGHRRVLLICMALVVPLPWNWLLATPTRIWPLFFNAILSGGLWAGLSMTQTNRLMEQAPAEGRGAYFAAFSVATGLAYTAASLAAGALVSTIGLDPVTFAGMTFHPYQAFFLLSGILRLAALVLGGRAI